jgi:hypothetical protein
VIDLIAKFFDQIACILCDRSLLGSSLANVSATTPRPVAPPNSRALALDAIETS